MASPADHTHDPRILRALRRIDRSCLEVVADLQALKTALADGAGHPHPGEMTPDEADHLGGSLGAVGALGAVILMEDLQATATRERVDDETWIGPDQLPDRPN